MSDAAATAEELHIKLMESKNGFVGFDQRLKVFLESEELILERGAKINLYKFRGNPFFYGNVPR
jgi:hypothetical protein